MGHNWIIDVLDDLNTFAKRNDLTLLADQLMLAQDVAAAEIASKGTGAPEKASDDGNTAQDILGRTGSRHCA